MDNKKKEEYIQEEQEQEQEIKESGIEEWDKEDEIGNLWDPYDEL